MGPMALNSEVFPLRRVVLLLICRPVSACDMIRWMGRKDLTGMKATEIGYIALILLLLAAFSVQAADFRCGSEIISPGDRKYDVFKKCGNPDNVEVWEEVRAKRELGSHLFLPGEEPPGFRFASVLVTVEEWEYNLGPGRFVRYLRFENGRLIKITTGDYGY
jgi:hypothetical protein